MHCISLNLSWLYSLVECMGANLGPLGYGVISHYLDVRVIKSSRLALRLFKCWWQKRIVVTL